MTCEGAVISYEEGIFPMIPSGTDAVFSESGTPYVGHDFRFMVHNNECNGIEGDENQWYIKYSYEVLQEDINGLNNALFGDRAKELKELQAYKDLLDQITFLVSIGEMTDEDLVATQNTVHEALKDGHNRYYKWYDLSRFPQSFIQEPEIGLVGTNNSLCNYLRKNNKVWYVSFQGDRVVFMGNNFDALNNCMQELQNELRFYAGGDWVNTSKRTTQRWELVQERVDLEFSNIHLIAQTWNTSEDEALLILSSEIEQELRDEDYLRKFVLAGFSQDSIDPIL